ncbi:MAG: Gfo/Idh/MocA family oxidoreductase [Hyphomicrobiales bacterium]|nr:Gfo/Idh/MocA family oxidoreductase [Hyphomicrobiales bacterium]
MKVLVAGCGSIGRRHAALLAARAEVAVVDLDGALAARTGAELGLRHFDDLDAALAWGPGGAVVATPNTSHLPVARACLDAGAGVLIEKPISADLAEAEVFLDYLAGTGGSAHVVCNMRFHPGVAGLAAHLHRVGAPRFARAQFGHYLPQMRPQARYQDLYCARRARGGGVILDAIHEIDYLMWLFGPVAAVTCEAARLSDLDIDVEDYAVAVLRHASGVRSEVHLDYLQRRKRRGCEIAGQDGTLVWLSDGKAPEHCALDLYTTGTETWQPLLASPAVDDDACYGALLDNFLAALDGRPHDLLSAEMATDELRVALAARRAAETGATVVPLEMAA